MSAAQITREKLERLLTPIRNMVRRTVTRGFLSLLTEGNGVQFVQLETGRDTTRDEVEHFQPFGFASFPLKNAQGLVFTLNGTPEHLVVLNLFNPDKRPTDLQEGECGLYNSAGQWRVFLTPDGRLSLGSKDATKGVARNGDKVKITAAALNTAFNPGTGGASFTHDAEGTIVEGSTNTFAADG
jgi:phage baseplate assembly protein V